MLTWVNSLLPYLPSGVTESYEPGKAGRLLSGPRAASSPLARSSPRPSPHTQCHMSHPRTGGPCVQHWPASWPVERPMDTGKRRAAPAESHGSRTRGGREGGWVRRHVLNWHSVASVSWMLSVSTKTRTVMVRMSRLLLVYSGMRVNKRLLKSVLLSTVR